jgi:hypothetical protein
LLILLSARAAVDVDVVGFTYVVVDDPPAEEGGSGGIMGGR